MPLGALLVENTASAVRARDESVLAESDATTTVTTEICHDRACLVRLAGTSALGGARGRNLVFFARHVAKCMCLFGLVVGYAIEVSLSVVGWEKKCAKSCLVMEDGESEFVRQNLGGERKRIWGGTYCLISTGASMGSRMDATRQPIHELCRHCKVMIQSL